MSDLPQSIDLTLRDVDAVDITASAQLLAALNFPELNLVSGSYEAAFVELLALELTEFIAAVNRLPQAIKLDVAMNLFRIEPDIGATASVVATLTVSDAGGVTIPAANTLVELDTGDGSPLRFVLLADVVIAPGGTTASGTFGALSFTAKANDIAPGAAMRIVSAAPALSTVVTNTVVSGGRDAETAVHYLARVTGVFANLSSTLVRGPNFTNFALQQPYVARATAIDRYDGAGGPPYTDNGHVTVVARGPSGNLSAPEKAALEAALEAETRVDLSVHVIDATVTPVNVTATVEVVPGSDPAVVQAAVEDALTAYLDPNSWPWAATVYRFALVKVMGDVDGVNRVVSITTPATDLALSGDGPLVSTGTLLITPV